MNNGTTGQSAKEIENLLNENIKHVYNRDKEALLSSFADDVTMFELMEPLQFNGKKSVDTRLTAWFASYKSKITQEIKNLKITAGKDVAISNCLMRTHGTGIDGENRDMWYRFTSGFKKVNGKWTIIHEHISEPIDLGTGKALFDLKP